MQGAVYAGPRLREPSFAVGLVGGALGLQVNGLRGFELRLAELGANRKVCLVEGDDVREGIHRGVRGQAIQVRVQVALELVGKYGGRKTGRVHGSDGDQGRGLGGEFILHGIECLRLIPVRLVSGTPMRAPCKAVSESDLV
ncbi:MAG: hypothetical protein H0U04_06920 [Rubrobacter sp.]|nr:hypothetical protein [Rubrobacter sp.]